MIKARHYNHSHKLCASITMKIERMCFLFTCMLVCVCVCVWKGGRLFHDYLSFQNTESRTAGVLINDEFIYIYIWNKAVQA